ncbi:MAG: ATP-binding cassette domain-containing protein [Thaumarchaeota archaeon]|nr:MAG: ATP-binding cassette domain-containing protein [Nitrososphaerota archaeon]
MHIWVAKSVAGNVMLEIRNLVSGYGKLAIIQDVSLKVAEGDFLAIVGPNGSGKSTLVKSILGLTNIFEGSIKFEGIEIKGWRPEKIAMMRLGYVPQLANVFPDLTVRENLDLGGITVRDARKRSQLHEHILNLFPILKSRPRQKAGLAPMVAEQLLQRLVEIRQKMSVTIVLVEQNARKALSLANRGLVLVQGKSAFEGTPDQISKDKDIIRLFLGELAI